MLLLWLLLLPERNESERNENRSKQTNTKKNQRKRDKEREKNNRINENHTRKKRKKPTIHKDKQTNEGGSRQPRPSILRQRERTL